MSSMAQTTDQVLLFAQYIHTLAIAREGSFTGPRRIKTVEHGAVVSTASVGYLVSDKLTIESAVFVVVMKSSIALGNVVSVGGISSYIDELEGVTSKTR